MARCVEATGELNVGAATVAMAAALHCLQRDLLVDSWDVSHVEARCLNSLLSHS